MPIQANYNYVVSAPGAEAAIAADPMTGSAGATASVAASNPVSTTVAQGGVDSASVTAALNKQRQDAVDKVNKAKKASEGSKKSPLVIWGAIAAAALLIFKKK